MHLDLIQYGSGAFAGGLVGLTLGLFGGGGSILAVPLMIYLVGVNDIHMAIGTSALAVCFNGLLALIGHTRLGNVRWRCAGLYSSTGVVGAVAGSMVGKLVDGQKLLILFAFLMMAVSVIMAKRRVDSGSPGGTCNMRNAPKVLGFGGATGVLSGFFGIGGGFLIVPGLLAATNMSMINAVGSSLVTVTLLGLTTAASYATSGLVDWLLAAVFIVGGAFGGFGGAAIAKRLSVGKATLNKMFAIMVFIASIYILYRAVH